VACESGGLQPWHAWQQQQEVEELRERGCIGHPEERPGNWAAGFVIPSPFWAPLPGSYKQALRAA